MKILLLIIFVFALVLVNLTSCSSGGSRTAYCSNCGKRVQVNLKWSGKYKNSGEYGNTVKIWDAWCKECGKYLGQFTGIN